MKTPQCVVPLMLASFFTHELDAVTQTEWRLLYVLRDLPDPQAHWWFVALHVPLFWAFIGGTYQLNAKFQKVSRVLLATFLIVHAALHLRLKDDPLYTFTSNLSWSLIIGPAVLSIIFLAIELRPIIQTRYFSKISRNKS